MTASIPTDITVPDGWTIEPIHAAFLLIRSPSGYMMTLDLGARGFRAGLNTTGRLHSTKDYASRGWRQALCADAIAILSQLEKTP